MQALNFPGYHFRLKNSENKTLIFDIIRRQFVVLQPEEWVRQHVVKYLLVDKKYPRSLVNVEKELIVNTIRKRYDLVVFKANGDLRILVECKAPNIKITQNTFDQIARYNVVLKADYLMLTNGLEHYYCKMNFGSEKYEFLYDIPEFSR